MNRLRYLKSALVGGASVLAIVHPAAAKVFDIPDGDLASALVAYMKQSDVELVYADNAVRGHKSHGAKGNYTETAALVQILRGTGFAARTMPLNAIGIVPEQQSPAPVKLAQAAPRRTPAAMPMAPTVETVVVTAQHKTENIQSVPISITAMSQQQLTERQIAAGPDLLRDVPNMNFSKTNFTGYNIELRGIGTQAISVTTDPAVAVAFNDTPFIRNHFFEQEFYDLQDVEVLRGPQGTLYGRNATAGVVNIKSALPTDSYEAMLSADVGNFSNRRLEGMLNIPIVGDTLDLRIAGEWTKRDGYTINELDGQNVDGRDLWSGRVTLGWKPTSDLQTYLVWEHFSEDDNRMRTAKQLCETAPIPAEVGGVPVPGAIAVPQPYEPAHYLSQSCEMTSLYSPDAFEVPNGETLPYYDPLGLVAPLQSNSSGTGGSDFDPYASTTQSRNLRVIQTTLNPSYRAKNDTLEFNADWTILPSLTLTSQTGYNNDFLWSTEDYNRFDTTPGAFVYTPPSARGCSAFDIYFNVDDCYNQVIPDPAAGKNGVPANAGIFCDPQLGCSDRLVAEDLSDERAWQLSQEFRLTSHFDGPLNFSAGGNYLHYETVEDYYVFINTVTLATAGWGPVPHSSPWDPGVSTNGECLQGGYQFPNLKTNNALGIEGESPCQYIDPNPITSLNNEGHNYFLSQNPYVLNSYALFGEMYYNIAPDLKATLGARWTEDQKHFIDIPSELLVAGYGYSVTHVVDQRWDAPTGRAVLDWTPNLAFTDQTLVYASVSHGYKAGGANPPGAELLTLGNNGEIATPIHPLTFKPEFIDAFELGTKNALLDNSLTINGDVFYYAYSNYQISEIVDRTAINNNYNATVKGGEIESNWEPLPGLKFGLTGGFEDATANRGDMGIDLMDRTAGNPNWIVVKPFATQASNCVLPTYVVAALILEAPSDASFIAQACNQAYGAGTDPVTEFAYMPYPTFARSGTPVPAGYPGFDPATAPNNGEGFAKNLGGNQLPNAPHVTTSFTAEYSMPISDDWVGTLHGDLYWQSQSWARIFNDPIDKLHGYSNVNLSLILSSANGWQVMGYVKNVFDTTAITGTFLNSDDSGLTTNVFLTDPRLYGIRVTKHLDQDDGFWGSAYNGYDLVEDIFGDKDGDKPPLWVTLGGELSYLDDAQQTFSPAFLANRPSIFKPSQPLETPPRWNLDESATVSFQPDSSDWVFSASVRYGRSRSKRDVHQQTDPAKLVLYYYGYKSPHATHVLKSVVQTRRIDKFADTAKDIGEQHDILDFDAGKDVGLGMFGIPDASSVLGAGVRFAQFGSRTNIAIKSHPDVRPTYFTFPPTFKTAHGNPIKFLEGESYHSHAAQLIAKRSFHGIGPSISWSGSAPFAGDANDGHLTVDWGANAAILFGRQRTRVHHQTTGGYHHGSYDRGNGYLPARLTYYQKLPPDSRRSRMVTVPNIGAMFGISYKYNNAKISFGYRADEFFGAMDGGIDVRRTENVGFFGPYANISIGLGG